MAMDLQLLGLLMKYGTVRSQRRIALAEDNGTYLRYQLRAAVLTTRLWDGLRCLAAFKMAAASLEVLFMSNERLRFLWTPAWTVTWLAAIFGVAAAAWYTYRLWKVKREMAALGLKWNESQQVNFDVAGRSSGNTTSGGLIGGFLYFDPKDPAWFVGKYVLNFGNKWVYALIACVVTYPLLVFGLA